MHVVTCAKEQIKPTVASPGVMGHRIAPLPCSLRERVSEEVILELRF